MQNGLLRRGVGPPQSCGSRFGGSAVRYGAGYGLGGRAWGNGSSKPVSYTHLENQVYEFENLEELRAFDPRYRNHSDNEAMALVARVFRVPESRIQGIRCLKAGMTNQSFLFQVEEKQYICRIPGPGTELLVNRVQEAKAYEAVRQLGITENLIYLNPENGYKIAEYFPDSRNVSAESWTDMERFMGLIRTLHQGGVRVSHRFDMRERIDFYETLCKTHGGVLFEDYGQVREQMNWLMDRLDEMERDVYKRQVMSVDICLDDPLHFIFRDILTLVTKRLSAKLSAIRRCV